MPPKTAKKTVDENFRFLFACIQHGDHGKIDFAKVVEETDYSPTKGAAAKRYERLMKAYCIIPNNNKPAPARGASKKRKIDEASADRDDDEEPPSPVMNTKTEKKIKVEKKEKAKIKQEHLVDHNAGIFRSYSPSSLFGAGDEHEGSEHGGVSGYDTPAYLGMSAFP